MVEAKFKPGKIAFVLGFESLSGTDQSGESTNHSFFPLYGTNHKFNGLMDYFYVGNHANNVGLNDVYAKALIPMGAKSSLGTDLHFFSSNADLKQNLSKNLGTELDLVFSRTIAKNIKMNAGYSQLFDTESMQNIKGVSNSAKTNNWGWVLLIVNPNLLKYSMKEEKSLL